MGEKIITDIVTIASGIIGVAIIAVLVSKQANTSNVITQATTGFGTLIKDAVSPVTGSGSSSLILPTL